jgi:hypothetical protein
MKRALLPSLVSFVLLACGGETPPPATAADAPAADAPASDAPPAADAAADKPAGGGDEAWSGEEAAKSEKAAPGSEGGTETRTMEVIAKIVKDNRQPVRDCMDKVQKQLPDLEGDMVIHFVIDKDGKVKKAEPNIERSSMKNPEVSECAIKVIKGISFPPSSMGKESEVNYPYNFKKRTH